MSMVLGVTAGCADIALSTVGAYHLTGNDEFWQTLKTMEVLMLEMLEI